MAQGERGPVGRLALAVGASALLHAWLLGGVAVHRPLTVGTQAGELRATLEPGVESSDPETKRVSIPPPPAQPPLPVSEPAAESVRVQPAAESTPAPSPAKAQPEPAGEPPAHVHEPKPSLDIPTLTDTTVYPTHELDVFPLPTAPLRPPYPNAERQANGAGQITVELVIDEGGVVREAQLVDASPPGYFDETALETFRAARFHPAQREGRAVRARIAIRVDFTPAGNRSDAGR